MPTLSSVPSQDKSPAKSASPGADDDECVKKDGAARGKRKHELEDSNDEFKSKKAAEVSNLLKSASKSTTKSQQQNQGSPQEEEAEEE